MFEKEEGTIKIIQEPKGNLLQLHEILLNGLSQDSGFVDAYLAIIHVNKKNELALFVNSTTEEKFCMPRVAEFCHFNVGELLLFYMGNIPDSLKSDLLEKITPINKAI